MGKHFFVIKHKGTSFKCFFDDDRKIHVMDAQGTLVAISKAIRTEHLELAKDTAMELVRSLEKKPQ